MGIDDGFVDQLYDADPSETREWLDSLDAVASEHGPGRAEYLIQRLLAHSDDIGLHLSHQVQTPYINTIPLADERAHHWFPGDLDLERRIRAFIRWNAAVMVVKANKVAEGIGGHLASFASSASLYDVGFNHFWHAKDDGNNGDSVYVQGHAAPGIYARAFLEGRLTAEQLDNFRREIGGNGLSSYPHPRLMPDFWEFPTVSMGLGPINSIYHARFNRYLHHRQLDDTSNSRVWCFVGDGECDEPETLGSIALAGRERLDNLTWVINCNLQRLDGPVRGNGKIIQELEGVFRGAGWNVIKVVWGSAWDELIENDVDGLLVRKMNETVDGEFQRYTVDDGAYIREHFFGPDPRLRKMVEHLSDEELRWLPRGGHDYRKLYAAYSAATQERGAPTVILAKTVKGWTLGADVEGRNSTHQIKKLSNKQLRDLRVRLHLEEEIPEAALADGEEPPYFRPPDGSPAHDYLMARRRALGGSLPRRVVRTTKPLELPQDSVFDEFRGGSGKNAASTTTAFTRMLRAFARDPGFGSRVVPIIPDEARTFGMDSLFKEFGIYASEGQKYEPVNHKLLLSYHESIDGQLLEEGITEAGSMASWTAAATSYATHGVPMVPFFIFYSMFGFQRVGDLIWAAADARARGFLLGATAGRTTLLGEGLQHQDGHSLVLASTVPTCEAYDPAFAYEIAEIIRHGIERMYGPDPEDVFYYLTLHNENYVMPPLPDRPGVVDGILEGLYRWADAPAEVSGPKATLLFSGPAQGAVREAATELAERWDVGAELWSATSYKRLREDALATERWNRLHPEERSKAARVTALLDESTGPIVATTDFMRAVPDQIARWIPADRSYTSLGTDGFGRSDTREALRRYFEVDAGHVVVATLHGLAEDRQVKHSKVAEAIAHYGIDASAAVPLGAVSGWAAAADRGGDPACWHDLVEDHRDAQHDAGSLGGVTSPASFPITFDDDANELLAEDPLALLFGMLLDQQVPMTWAFRSPMVLKERFGDRWSPAGIAAMDPDDVVEVFCRKPAVHRYPAAMARRAHGIAVEIVEKYDGDTASLWTTAKSGETLYKRVSSLPGFATEKSQIFVALLAKRFDVKPHGWKAAAGAFSDTQPRSAADVNSLPKLREVQAWKKAQKAAKKSKSEFSM